MTKLRPGKFNRGAFFFFFKGGWSGRITSDFTRELCVCVEVLSQDSRFVSEVCVCVIRGAKESLKNKVFFHYQGSCGESAVDRLLWLPSVSIPCPRAVCEWVLCVCVRAEPCGKTGGEWVRGAGRVWPGVTERGAGQMQAGTDSSSPLQSVLAVVSHSRSLSLIPPPRHAATESKLLPSLPPLPGTPLKIKALTG